MQMKIGRMQGAAIAYHNTQRIFGFEYIKLKDMENRVFGCSEFSDVIFDKSLGLLETILDNVLDDQIIKDSTQPGDRLFRIGFYANEMTRMLDVFVEIFNDDKFYNDRFRDMYNPDFMQSPIDYYNMHNIKPKVIQYGVGIYPVLNGRFIDFSPIFFEKGDHLDVKFYMQRVGSVEFNRYM